VTEYYAPIDPAVLRRERERARQLRASQWWKRRISDGMCHYCRQRVGIRALTMDHIVPLGRGGRSARGNVVAACKSCNTKKQSLVPVEWEEYLRRLEGPRSAVEGPFR
jgi:5-methylcytosine-specific restriction endonuclease McrA